MKPEPWSGFISIPRLWFSYLYVLLMSGLLDVLVDDFPDDGVVGGYHGAEWLGGRDGLDICLTCQELA